MDPLGLGKIDIVNVVLVGMLASCSCQIPSALLS